MAHLSAVPIRLNDGRNVKGLRVLELKTALESFGVPAAEHAQNKADKLSQLINAMSKFRASQGFRGALEDGRLIDGLNVVDMKAAIAAHGGDPNFTGCLQTELQRLVRFHTGRLSPLAAPLPQVTQPQQRALRSSVRIQAAAVANNVGFVFTPVADGPTVTGQVPSPTATGPILSPTATMATTTTWSPTTANPTPPQAASHGPPPAVANPPLVTPTAVGTAAFFQAAQPWPAAAQAASQFSIFSICPMHQSPPGSLNPYNCSNPWLQVNDGCILSDYCSHCPGLLQNGCIHLLDAQILVAANVLFDQSDVPFGSTINLRSLNALADRVSLQMLNSPPPRTQGDIVKAARSLHLSPSATLSQSDFDLPARDPALPPSIGLATLFNANVGEQRSILKFLQASCIVYGAGQASDAQHAQNRALSVLDSYTFDLLPMPSFARSAGRDSLTLNSVFPRFLEFPYLPGAWYPTDILSFMRMVEDNAALASGCPVAYNVFVPLILSTMEPPPPFLTSFLSDVPDPSMGAVIDELKAVLLPSASSGDNVNNASTLRLLEHRLSSFPLIVAQDTDCTPEGVSLLSPLNALERVKLIRAQLSSTRDLGSSSSSSSSEPSSTGGALARVIAVAIAAAGPFLKQVDPLGNSVQDNVHIVKIVVRCGLPFLVNCICKLPPNNIAASCPGTRKIYNARDSLAYVVAEELLKGRNLEDSDALPLLTTALKPQTLLDILSGSNISAQVLVDQFNIFTSIQAPGSGALDLTIEVLGRDMGRLHVFVKFVIRLLAALGMDASGLMAWYELIERLHDCLPVQARGIVSRVLKPDLDATFRGFQQSIRSWVSSNELIVLSPLAVYDTLSRSALQRVEHDRRHDLSGIGVPSSGVFSNSFTVIPSLVSSSQPTSVLPVLQQATPSPVSGGQQAWMFPSSSSSAYPSPGAVTPSSARGGGNKRKQNVAFEPRSGGAAATRAVAPQSSSRPSGRSSSNYNKFVKVQVCSVGRVACWAKTFVNWSALSDAFMAENPSVQLKDDHMAVLLSRMTGDDNFDLLVPPYTPSFVRDALRPWFDAKRSTSFAIQRPPDFRQAAGS